MAPPLERFFKLPREKREGLIAAARAEFVANGFERASFNRIIEAAGVSKGAMYYYFADKADLFSAVIDELVGEVLQRVGPVREARDADDFWDAIAEWGEATALVTLTAPDLAALGRVLYSDSGAQRTVNHLREQVHEVVVSTLASGQALGAVRTDVPLDMLAAGTTFLLLGLDRWFANRFEELAPDELERLTHKVLELLRDMAGPKPTSEAH